MTEEQKLMEYAQYLVRRKLRKAQRLAKIDHRKMAEAEICFHSLRDAVSEAQKRERDRDAWQTVLLVLNEAACKLY